MIPMNKINLDKLTTERRNSETSNLDEMTILEACQKMNQEDQKVAYAVEKEIPSIEKVIEQTIVAFKKGGRLIYLGAGTSGRLGVLDAAECVPTFGVSPEMVVGLIAGGEEAMTVAVEGAEDSLTLGKQDLVDLKLNQNDMVIGRLTMPMSSVPQRLRSLVIKTRRSLSMPAFQSRSIVDQNF